MSTVGILLQLGGAIFALLALLLGFCHLCDDVELWLGELRSAHPAPAHRARRA